MRGKNLGTAPTQNNKRTLRYAVVSPDRVYNWLGMSGVTSWVFFPELRKDWWSDETVALRERIQDLYMEYFDEETGHFTNLKVSMIKDGFHAPVNTVTGQPRGMYLNEVFPVKTLPPNLQKRSELALCTHTFGGSRVIIAKELGMDIPCFIYDYTNAFPDAEVLRNSKQIKAKFPASYSVGNILSQVIVRSIVHTHQKNRKNDGTEKATRLKTIERIRQTLKDEGTL